MNWIIRKTIRLSCHTYLNQLLVPILDDIKGLNWLISDLDYGSYVGDELPLNHEEEYFILSEAEFQTIVKTDVQIYWGVFLGIPAHINITVDENSLPYAEGSAIIWKNGNIQHPDAQIEIVCWDSGYTIVKFKDQQLSDKFKNYFEEAVELEKFKSKTLPHY